MSSCCGGNCGCGSSCKCGNGCNGYVFNLLCFHSFVFCFVYHCLFRWFCSQNLILTVNFDLQMRDVSRFERSWDHHHLSDHHRRCCPCQAVTSETLIFYFLFFHFVIILVWLCKILNWVNWVCFFRHFDGAEMSFGSENGCKCGDNCTCNPCTCKWRALNTSKSSSGCYYGVFISYIK